MYSFFGITKTLSLYPTVIGQTKMIFWNKLSTYCLIQLSVYVMVVRPDSYELVSDKNRLHDDCGKLF